MARIVIFGGNGFLGTNLIGELSRQNRQIVCVDRVPGPSPVEGCEWVVADFLDAEAWAERIEPGDVVFHLVSTTLPRSSNDDPAFDVQSNLVGTLRLLDECRRRQAARVIFVSSGGTVYGPPQVLPVDEDHPTDPQSSYGITKLAIEKYLALYRRLHGLDYLVFRLSNPYGPHQNPYGTQGVISVFLRKALTGEPIEVWGDGSVVRDYIYVSDAVEALARSVTYSGAPRLFNLGSGTGTSVTDILTHIERLVGHGIDVRYTPSRVEDVKANVLSIRRICDHLDWKPTTSLEQGLRLSMDYLSERIKTDV